MLGSDFKDSACCLYVTRRQTVGKGHPGLALACLALACHDAFFRAVGRTGVEAQARWREVLHLVAYWYNHYKASARYPTASKLRTENALRESGLVTDWKAALAAKPLEGEELNLGNLVLTEEMAQTATDYIMEKRTKEELEHIMASPTSFACKSRPFFYLCLVLCFNKLLWML